MSRANGTQAQSQAHVRQIRTPEHERLRKLIDRLEDVVTRFEEMEAAEAREEAERHRGP
jgi:mRNA-degrading endonuclease toxin of MazEF toxin-antitoxin module